MEILRMAAFSITAISRQNNCKNLPAQAYRPTLAQCLRACRLRLVTMTSGSGISSTKFIFGLALQVLGVALTPVAIPWARLTLHLHLGWAPSPATVQCQAGG